MANETWIDGFNLFHRWDETREGFSAFRNPATDMAGLQENALRLLSSALAKRAGVIVFMDGGLSQGSQIIHGLRVRFPGPGKKADDAMVESLDAKQGRARSVTAVTSDRGLAATLRSYGAKIITVEDFIARSLQRKPGKKQPPQYKTANLSKHEVDDWLEYFGESAEGTEEE
ncbi:MAG: NYN domain-containing protein [Planctomycetes bacterium]|nr:NYN domain-containing protein [Planctomycetota bacterium]